jgi:hypothetical protein
MEKKFVTQKIYTRDEIKEYCNGFALHSEPAIMIKQLLCEEIEMIKYLSIVLEYARNGYKTGDETEIANVNYALNTIQLWLNEI